MELKDCLKRKWEGGWGEEKNPMDRQLIIYVMEASAPVYIY